MFACPATDDFFRSRIDQMIDLRHPLAVLASRMPWQELEARVSHLLMRKARAAVAMPDLDLFGEQPIQVCKRSNAGRPRVPLRIMIALLYLKHAFNESDEGVVLRWAETPTWQFFCGQAYFEHRQPCDASTLIKFRKLLGEEGVEELLAQTIEAAVQLELIHPQALKEVLVDSTVQHKAIAYPTDSRLLEVARTKLVQAAKQTGIALKQTFAKEGRQLSFKAGRYAHARQFKRMRRSIKRQKTIVGRLLREIERKAQGLETAVQQTLAPSLAKAAQLLGQAGRKKMPSGQRKLYAWHAPEVDCISKGKARQPYEFGVKVGIASTIEGNLIVGARAFHGNPYDGHTLAEQIEQASILMQDCQVSPQLACTDLGYRGVDASIPDIKLIHRGKSKRLSAQQRQLLKQRSAIEPVIGHLKSDHRMNLCHLKGKDGDSIHAVLCAAGFNIRWLLRMIAKKGLPFLQLLFLHLILAFDGLQQAVKAHHKLPRALAALVGLTQSGRAAAGLAWVGNE